MSIHTPWRPRLAGPVVLAMALVTGISHAAATIEPVVVDLLDRPARISSRADRSVLLAVGRADRRLVAVGEMGILLLSDDNGATWRQVKVPTSVTLTNVRFVSANVGWVVGHGAVILHTRDGGETWARQLDGRQAAQLDVDAARVRVAAGDPAGDRALVDAERQLKDGPDKPLLDVHFFDERNGLVVGAYGLIFATDDGGKTWRSLKQRLDNPKGRHLYGIHAIGAKVHVVGEQGALYRSIDGGGTFSEIRTPYVGTYFGALTALQGEIIVYGLRGNAFRSSDDGVSWQKVDLGLPVTLTSGVRLADGVLALVDETGRVLQSRDGGQSFKAMPVPQPSPFTGIIQAADGSLVLSGARGMTRLIPATTMAEQKQ